MAENPDGLIVGGGVIGLSLAWELARQGLRITLIDRSRPGREASWAGAGILPPAKQRPDAHSYEKLCGLSYDLHAQWAAELRESTGIDTGYRRCGGLYLARTPGEVAALAGWAAVAADEQITVRRLTATELEGLEPAISTDGAALRAIYHVPEEAQLRNPRHLQALQRACEKSGVTIVSNAEVRRLVIDRERVLGAETNRGTLTAGFYCFATGAWTGDVLGQAGFSISVLPMRGQMLLLRLPRPAFSHVINEGSRYLVPRDDGRVLVGSTEEEVGFDKRTTEEGLRELRQLACSLVPALSDASLEQSWAGLRPASFDGFPYLGRLPELVNAFVAAGHFRSGLYLSTGTAVVMRQLICSGESSIALDAFRVGR